MVLNQRAPPVPNSSPPSHTPTGNGRQQSSSSSYDNYNNNIDYNQRKNNNNNNYSPTDYGYDDKSYNNYNGNSGGKQISPYDSQQDSPQKQQQREQRFENDKGGNGEKQYKSDNNTGKYWDPEATRIIMEDKRGFMAKVKGPPQIPDHMGEPDPMADPRKEREICYILLPKLPPRLYDESNIPKPDIRSPIKDLVRLKPDNMWAEHEEDDTKLDPFPPLIAKPTIPVIIILGAMLAFWGVLEFPPLQPILERKFPIATQTYIAELASIPIVSIAFTYCHIWLALWLLFHPIKFVGLARIPGTNVGQPGWQGIIPFKAEIMARITVRNMAVNLIDPVEMFRQVDPKVVSQEVGPIIRDTARKIVEAIAMQYNHHYWSLIPQRVKDELVEQIAEDTPDVLEDIFEQMAERFEEVFSIEDLTVKWLTDHPRYLVNMFVKCGWRELCLIRNNGAVMGFFFGMIQLVLWIFYPEIWYVIPFNMIVGGGTNTIALLLIFRPIYPKKIGPIRFHGLFYKDQENIAEIYSKMVADRILNTKNIVDTMTAGPYADKTYELIQERVGVVFQKMLAPARGMERYAIDPQLLQRLQRDFGNQMVKTMPDVLESAGPYMTKALNVEAIIKERIQNLDYADFDRLLHPVFQQDEWKLVGTGALLGAFIGVLQIFILKPEVLGAEPDYTKVE